MLDVGKDGCFIMPLGRDLSESHGYIHAAAMRRRQNRSVVQT
jgi:hypothetical protein